MSRTNIIERQPPMTMAVAETVLPNSGNVGQSGIAQELNGGLFKKERANSLPDSEAGTVTR